MKPIYLDYNATTPVDPRVAEAMLPYLHTHFGNPSSTHSHGKVACQAVEKARTQLSMLLGCKPGEIIFTGGGTESNNIVIQGIARSHPRRGNHIITTAIEHPAVLNVCTWLTTIGFEVSIVPVDPFGQVDLEFLEKSIRPDTILISVMHSNNEVGTIQPIQRIAELARSHGIPFHTDAAQSIGKIPVNVKDLGIDFLTIAGHKFYAPKGVGALYIREGHSLPPLMMGASQERDTRPGTENVLEIVGLGAASEIVHENQASESQHLEDLSTRLRKNLMEHLGEIFIQFNGHPQERLPNTLSASFLGIEANQLLDKINENVSASAGAACHAGSVQVSYVLAAMGIPVEWAMGTLRLSVGRFTTSDDVDEAARVISQAARSLMR